MSHLIFCIELEVKVEERERWKMKVKLQYSIIPIIWVLKSTKNWKPLEFHQLRSIYHEFPQKVSEAKLKRKEWKKNFLAFGDLLFKRPHLMIRNLIISFFYNISIFQFSFLSFTTIVLAPSL